MKAKKDEEEQERQNWEENLCLRMVEIEDEAQKMRKKKDDEWQEKMDILRSGAENIKKMRDEHESNVTEKAKIEKRRGEN